MCLVDVDLLLNIMWYELLCYGMKDMVIGYLGEKGNIVKMIDEFLKLGDSYWIVFYGRIVSNNLLICELVMGI